MDKVFTIITTALFSGGPNAIILILMLIVAFLVWDRLGLIKTMKDNTEYHRADIARIIEKYQEGQINVIQALNEIKLILVKLEAKT